MTFTYQGKIFLNCVSSAQKSALASDQAFGTQLRSSYGTDFAEAQGIFNNLNGGLEAIVDKGPSQTGMSAPEEAARRSEAINNAAAANKNIQAAIGEKADAGGATPGVESGVTAAVRAKAMTDVESNLNNTEAGITDKNYELGRQQYDTALKADMALPAATMDPVSGAAGAVNNADKVSGDQADANQAASSSWMGLVGGLAGSAASAFGAKKCWVAAATYDGWDDPRVDVIRTFIFDEWAPTSFIGNIVAKLYMKFGERVAVWVTKSRLLKASFKIVFDRILKNHQE